MIILVGAIFASSASTLLSLFVAVILLLSSSGESTTRHHPDVLPRRFLNATTFPDDASVSVPIEFDLSSIHGVYDWTSLAVTGNSKNNGTTEQVAFSDFSSGFRLFQRHDTPMDTILLSGTIIAGNDFVATFHIAGNASMMYQNSEDGQNRSLGAVPVALKHIYWTAKVCLADIIAPDCPTIGQGAVDIEDSVRNLLSDDGRDLQLVVVTNCQPMCGSNPTVILEGRSGSLVGEFVRRLDATTAAAVTAAAVAVKNDVGGGVPAVTTSSAKGGTRTVAIGHIATWATWFALLVPFT
jgi:hypothetical protein